MHALTPNRQELKDVFDRAVWVEPLDSGDVKNLSVLGRPELGVTFTKLRVWSLTDYAKCVFLDADTVVLHNIDELFQRCVPSRHVLNMHALQRRVVRGAGRWMAGLLQLGCVCVCAVGSHIPGAAGLCRHCGLVRRCGADVSIRASQTQAATRVC